jgi:hypothetical protein
MFFDMYIETVSYHLLRLVAILLGQLGMNADEAIDAVRDIALAIFSDSSHPNYDPELRTRQLSESIKSILQARGISPDRKMQEKVQEPVGCKVYARVSCTFT